ncbi:MAG TPA: outer membrane protein assembly factor BamA [Chthoniobacteraceae bacterium]|nr:outer membrane protein assembly factor BamA [Chthoniobacteraceae bacterium]
MTIFRQFIAIALGFFVALGQVTSTFGQITVPGPPSAPPVLIVRSIEIQYAGPQTVSREKILANMRTQVGKPFSQQAVEDDVRSLYATGDFSNVRIFGEQQGDGVKVMVVVQGKAKISTVNISGVTRFKETRIRKEITVKPNDALNEATLEADRQKILEYYSTRGYTDVDVKVATEEETAGTVKVLFSVNEGGKTIVSDVKFEGNASIKTRDLNRVVKTKKKSIFNIFTKGGKLNADQVTEDVSALREYYQNHGYIDAEVLAPRLDRTGEKVEVTYIIREGPQYHVGKINYGEPKVFTVEEVSRATKLKEGAIYSPTGLRADIKAIQDLYGSHGYVDFQASANTSPGGPQILNVQYAFDEGTQSYVEHINISGNVRTKDKVIRREIAVAPGDVMNTVRMDASKQRLQNLNYFDKVEVYPGETLIPGRKDVNVIVNEKRTGSFNFGAGFSSIDNLLGFAEITQSNFDILHWPNFTGGGEKFRLRVQYGVSRQDVVLSLTEPYFMDRKLSVGGEVFYRKASFVSDIYDEKRYGFDVNARKALNEFTAVRLGYRLENIGIENVDSSASDAIKAEEGSRWESRVSTGITIDKRDSVFLTRKGYKIDFSAYIAGGFLGGDTDIYGFDIEAAKYILLPGDTILTINGEVGSVATWSGGDRVPIFDRLFLGGANNLRGYKFRDVGPKDDHGEPLGGNTLVRGTVEYTFPVIEKVRGAIFYDIGFVNAGSYKFSPSKESNGSAGLNMDVGIGVRLDLPIGPVRIDYGIPISSDSSNGSSGKFNFNIGYQF